MPNKTIYVSDTDLGVAQRAQELAGGNLSAAISTALRRYVEAEEGRLEGWDEITVKVGRGKVRRKQRFTGMLLAEWGHATNSKVDTYRVYRSRRGHLVLWVDKSADWVGSGSGDWIKDLRDWRQLLGVGEHSWGFVEGESTLEVVDDVEQLREKVPAEFFDLVRAAINQPPVEDLDI